MKHKVFALILALTVVAWTQTSTQTTPAQNAAPAEKAKCACCDKMSADSKDAHASCMRDHSADAKDMASCCAGKDEKSCCGKDAKSCMKDDKTMAACCKDGCGKEKDKTAASCCDRKAGKECGKSCCGGANKSEKPA
jgi:hypothetical protein